MVNTWFLYNNYDKAPEYAVLRRGCSGPCDLHKRAKAHCFCRLDHKLESKVSRYEVIWYAPYLIRGTDCMRTYGTSDDFVHRFSYLRETYLQSYLGIFIINFIKGFRFGKQIN